MSKDQIRKDFDHNTTLHSPKDGAIGAIMDELRGITKAYGDRVIDLVPVSRELAMSLRAAEDALMYAIAGVARHQDEVL